MKGILFAGFALILLLSCVNSTLTIIRPSQLGKDIGQIPYSLANYGNIPYGTTFYGTGIFSDPQNGCNPINEQNINQFDRVDEADEKNENLRSVGIGSPIYMMERGGCTFVTKSRNAQDSNGKVAIIYNDIISQSVDDLILMDSSDHSGKGLMVATVFIDKLHSDQIRKYQTENPDVNIVFKIQFKHPVGKDLNKIKFWMSSMNSQSYEFLRNFEVHYKEFSKEGILMDFSVHFVTQTESDPSKQDLHCISNGRFCSPSYNVGGSDIYSREVVLEDLRQLVMFDYFDKLWWSYQKIFGQKCLTRPAAEISACSDEVLKETGATDTEIAAVKRQFKKSFVFPKDSGIDFNNFEKPITLPPNYESNHENSRLEKERQKQYAQSVSMIPTLIFNGEYFRGDTSSDSAIYEFICSSFDIQPNSCFDSYSEWINFKNKEIHRQIAESSYGFWFYFVLVLFIVSMMYLISVVYRRMIKNEMQQDISSQVNTAVSSYFMLNDSKNKN